jgi:hypothetical protein
MKIELASEKNVPYWSVFLFWRNIRFVQNSPIQVNWRNMCITWKKTTYVRSKSVLTTKSTLQKINKEILDLKYTIDQMDLVDVYRTFHPTSTQYTFFLAAHGTFSKIDHILGHKASLSKYKNMEIIPCILSDRAIKLEHNKKIKTKNMQTAGN